MYVRSCGKIGSLIKNKRIILPPPTQKIKTMWMIKLTIAAIKILWTLRYTNKSQNLNVLNMKSILKKSLEKIHILSHDPNAKNSIPLVT